MGFRWGLWRFEDGLGVCRRDDSRAGFGLFATARSRLSIEESPDQIIVGIVKQIKYDIQVK